jgi:hypothetical protein
MVEFPRVVCRPSIMLHMAKATISDFDTKKKTMSIRCKDGLSSGTVRSEKATHNTAYTPTTG